MSLVIPLRQKKPLITVARFDWGLSHPAWLFWCVIPIPFDGSVQQSHAKVDLKVVSAKLLLQVPTPFALSDSRVDMLWALFKLQCSLSR